MIGIVFILGYKSRTKTYNQYGARGGTNEERLYPLPAPFYLEMSSFPRRTLGRPQRTSAYIAKPPLTGHEAKPQEFTAQSIGSHSITWAGGTRP